MTPFKSKVLEKVPLKRIKSQFKTTSFTLHRSDYEKFLKICQKENRSRSDIIREMILIFIKESENVE